MLGGTNQKLCGCVVRRLSTSVLSGLLCFVGADGLQGSALAETADACGEERVEERSVVVKSGVDHDETLSALAEIDQLIGRPLEPIAKVSEREPDLAVPELAELNSAEPVLAKPVEAGPAGEDSVAANPTEAPETSASSATQTSSPVIAPTAHSAVTTPEKYAQLIAVATDANDTQQLDNDLVSFHGITPGISTREEVLRAWGQPLDRSVMARKLRFEFDRLSSVSATFQGDLVETIVVELSMPLSTSAIIESLSLNDSRPTVLTDNDGAELALVFPERGVALRFPTEMQTAMATDHGVAETEEAAAPQEPLRQDHVVAIVIQPTRAAAFLLRVQNNSPFDLTNNVEDLQIALKLDHTSAHARWLLSDSYLTTGKAVAAERLAAEAVELEPESEVYLLQWAKCLRELARYDVAVEKIRDVLLAPTVTPIVRAQALHQMGLMATLGSQDVAQRAAPLHAKAIEIADELAASSDKQVSRAANQLLVDAHLAMAAMIAEGSWGEKNQIVPQWIERASALAEGMIAKDADNLPLRLQVAVGALSIATKIDPPIKPDLWIQEAIETADLLREKSDDPLALAQVDWKLGLVYFHAARIEHRRGEPENSLRYGQLADEKLADLSKQRDELPDTGYVLGDLYFQIGAVHAVHNEDHEAACHWYDRAAELLLNPVPVTTLAVPREHGDALVSMGVSFWNTGQTERAVELTQAGADLVEQAVASGLLLSESLEVPYGNLAAMYQAQGETKSAAKYKRLAHVTPDAGSQTKLR